MMRKAFFAISLAAASLVAAQQLTPAAPGVKRFTDPESQVSFGYPSTWTLAASNPNQAQPFMFPLAISLPLASPQRKIRALVFTRSIPGVPSWPRTEFSGAEIGYDARPAAAPGDCRKLARAEDSHGDRAISQLTIHRIPYWHGSAGDGGMSQSISDDIYTTFIQTPTGGSCLLFDFAVYSSLMPGDTPPRALSPRERAIVHRTMLNILSSVRIPTPTR